MENDSKVEIPPVRTKKIKDICIEKDSEQSDGQSIISDDYINSEMKIHKPLDNYKNKEDLSSE